MATEEAEVAAATQDDKKGGGIGKTIGLGFGIFVLVIAAQFVTGIVGCMVLPGKMPGCPAPEEVSAEGAEGESEAAPKGPPIYHAFDPPLVVSLQEGGTMRFLQVTVEAMARDDHSIKAVQSHMPVIRNNLLNILGGRSFAELTSREGKEAIRKECLTEVQNILKANDPADPEHPITVEDLYFTSFVVQ